MDNKISLSQIELKGEIVNRSISNNEIIKIKSAKNIEQVSSTMGKILDFLCQTQKEKAKRLVFKLTHDNIHLDEKLQSLEQLKNLTTKQSKLRQFDNKNSFEINIIPNEQRCLEIKKSILDKKKCNEKTTELADDVKAPGVTEQFKNDIGRADYFFDGEKIKDKTKIVERCKDNLALQLALSQTILCFPATDEDVLLTVPNNGDVQKLTYETTFNEDDTISVIVTTLKDIAQNQVHENFEDELGMLDDPYNKTIVRVLKLQIKITIAKDQTIQVDSMTRTIIR